MTSVAIAFPRSRRSLPANAVLALAGDLASKGAQLAVVVACARLLPVSQVALLGVCLAAATLLMSLLDAGTSLVITRDGAAGGSAATLLARTGIIRLPLAFVTVAGAAGAGLVTGHLVAAVLAAVVGLLGAVSLSTLAVYRAQQDLSIEAAQKLIAGLLSLGAAVVFVVGHRTGAAALAGLALGPALTLPSLLARQWAQYRPAPAPSARAVLRDALPFGAMALATLAYYRTPTLVLGAFGSHAAVARYTIASTLGFGTLAVANAITTGLLPRLASLAPAQRPALARDSLVWTLKLSIVAGAVIIGGGPRLLSALLGRTYGAAFTPLAVLLASTLLIGASGVLGTVLTVEKRTGALVRQVGIALVANVALSLALAPRFGADGAAVATLLTEVLALGLLLHSAEGLVARPTSGVVTQLALAVGAACMSLTAAGPARPLMAGVAIGIALLDFSAYLEKIAWRRYGFVVGAAVWLGLDVKAIINSYGLRVISDAPTYLAILQKLAATPMHSVSVFMPTLTIDDPHATPYTQAIALVWRGLAGAHAKPDPVALNRLLQIVGLGVTMFVLHAAYTWVRRQAGRRAGLIALPVLLLLFGPGHIIWAGDLTFHGFLYASYYPQTIATGFLLWSLIAVDGPPVVWRFLIAPLPVAATMVVHPFTGTLLAVLIATTGSVAQITRRGGYMLGSWALVVGYAIASRWPEYSLSHAIAESGVKGPVLVVACAVLPALAGQFGWAWRLLSSPVSRLGAFVERGDRVLAYAGLAGVLALAAWESWLFTVPNSDPLIHSNHLSLYWVEESWRWPLMFAAGAVGLVGLVRLARRGHSLPLLWTLGCFAMGIAGAVGVQLPLWWRFLLFAQLPVALGVAVWLSDAVAGWTKRAVVATYTFSGLFKLATLLLLPVTITYFGSSLQGSYALGKMLPPGPEIVASDPFTSYFVPAATGHSVLVVTKAHVASQDELNESENGYALLHRFYSGKQWWWSAQTMYRHGVRYVLVQKQTSLAPPDLVTFSTGPTPLIRTAHDRAQLGTYFWRNNRVGVVLKDSPDYVLYRLSKKKLFG